MVTTVIRSFSLRDIPLFIQLQRSRMPLQLEQTLVRPRSPLGPALLDPFPWHGIGIATYVLEGKDRSRSARGIAQMQKRPGRPEADLLFLSPRLDAHAGADDIWCRLLSHCAQEAGQFGIQRLFATLPDDPQMLDIFMQVGFSLYAREDVYRLGQVLRPAKAPENRKVRRYREEDNWALQRLYATYTPRLVQQAEGVANGDARHGREPSTDLTFVLERGTEIAAALQIEIGSAGHWLRAYGNTQDAESMEALLRRGLAALASYRERPVYSAVRDYQGGLRALLSDQGFQPFATWNRLVKHTVSWVKEPALKVVPALERGVGRTMSVGHNGNGQSDRALPEPAHASAGKPS
jgi:hypothetical protein